MQALLNFLTPIMKLVLQGQRLFALLFVISNTLFAQQIPYEIRPTLDQCNNIRSYLSNSASAITHSYFNGINNLDDWKSVKESRREELLEMLGLINVPIHGDRSSLNMVKTGTLKKKGYRIDNIYYESLPGLFVTANLYIPEGITKPIPAILYLCGHAPDQKAYYQGRAQKFAQLGFVCLIIETIQFGEVRGEHWGANTRGWFHWYSRGYNPGGVDLWNGIRALDLLSQLPEVDKDKLGVTGPSGGGSQSWYLAAVDSRVKAVAPVAGAATLDMQIYHRTVDSHCDCMMPVNTHLREFSDIGALIAPRPLMIASPDRDDLYSIESIRALHHNVEKAYSLYNAKDNISMIESHGGHADRGELRPMIFSFFVKHLMGKDVAPDKIGDFDPTPEVRTSVEELRVFKEDGPKNNRTLTIQDSFIKLAEPPELNSSAELIAYRNKVVDFLKKKTFKGFPTAPVSLDTRLEFRFKESVKYETRVYNFVPEKDWRLRVTVNWNQPPEKSRPILLVLRNPNEKRGDAENFISGTDKNLNVAYFEARGIGDTGWASNLQWHVRRASAWTGRTIASMRVYDVLRCIEVLRSLEGGDQPQISIAASGEMAAVALYVTLLDGRVNTLIIKDPPASQNLQSHVDGSGEAIEMLNCLRITDLAQVAGIVPVKQLISLSELPDTYQWTDAVFRKFRPGEFKSIKSLAEWNPYVD